MKDRAAGDFVFGGSLIIVHLFTTKNEPLLCRRNAFLLLNAFLDPLNLVCWLNIDFDLLAGERFYLDQHPGGDDETL